MEHFVTYLRCNWVIEIYVFAPRQLKAGPKVGQKLVHITVDVNINN